MILLIWLQIMDLATTMTFMHMGMREANWLVSSAKDPIQRMFELKIIFVAYAVWVSFRRFNSNVFQNILTCAVGVYVLVISWNLFFIMRAMGIL
jgi:hypothetical protein